MKHFSEQGWADFVRGVGASQSNREIADHIASGCADCATSVGMWRKVQAIAINEPSLTPPDDVVRMVKLEFTARQSAEPSPWTMARLVFDSLIQPLTAGVRSGASESRQLMFEAEGTMVDLFLDHEPQGGTVSLVGQVVDKKGARIAPRQVAVIVWTESGQALAETASNEFGEFQMEIAPQERLRLSIEIVGAKTVRIPPINLKAGTSRSVT